MSISGLSGSNTTPSQIGTSQTNFGQAFAQLTSALKSGNLAGAQQAYSTLNDLQTSSGHSSTTTFSKALGQIGQSLADGDLSGAQQALQSFQQGRGTHHLGGHHRGGASTSSSSAPLNNSASSTGAGSSTTSSLLDVSA